MRVVFEMDPETGNVSHHIDGGIPVGALLMMSLILTRAANGVLDMQAAAQPREEKPTLQIARSMPTALKDS